MNGETLGSVDYYPHSQALIDDVKNDLRRAFEKSKRAPKVMVMGALGRCGRLKFLKIYLIDRGSVDFLESAGITDILKWDMEETRSKYITVVFC